MLFENVPEGWLYGFYGFVQGWESRFVSHGEGGYPGSLYLPPRPLGEDLTLPSLPEEASKPWKLRFRNFLGVFEGRQVVV